ncbi:MAG TPA: glycosyltransferase [Puia sp.]|jgi:glycosyltransferase involved in cell wall biosynthesis|nr:glycosyltransferase [Puia sp.]
MRKNKPPLLVILSPGFPADEQDTSCLPAQQVFVRALNSNYPGLKVVIIAFEYPKRKDRYSWSGNTVIALNGWKKGRMSKLLTCLAAWRQMNLLRRNTRMVGALSFWCTGCALTGKYYAKWKGLRHFAWILGQDARKGNVFIPLIRPVGGELVAMSNFLAGEFERNYGIRPAHVIPNGVDPSLFTNRGMQRDIDLLGVGSLIPLKRYDLFITVVKELSRDLPSICGVLCGTGPEQERLQQMIDRLGLDDRVRLAGGQSHQAALGFMQRSRILLHTSSYEGFSTVCLEALYAGAHVISFCDAVGSPVKNWHVVTTIEEMIGLARKLLLDEGTVYESVRLFTMDESVRQMMELFSYSDEATASMPPAMASKDSSDRN